jgi:arginine exporter protein ArgO
MSKHFKCEEGQAVETVAFGSEDMGVASITFALHIVTAAVIWVCTLGLARKSISHSLNEALPCSLIDRGKQ